MELKSIIDLEWAVESETEISPMSITTQCGLTNYCNNGLFIVCNQPSPPSLSGSNCPVVPRP